MADNHPPHEIETIIAQRNIADAAKATADTEAKKQVRELADKVKEAFSGVQAALLEELVSANAAIKRGGRTEEFRFQSNSQPGAGKLMAANLTLSDGEGQLQHYVITVDAADGKIVVRSRGVTMQQSLANVLQVTREDWSKFLSGVYAGNMR